MKKQRRNKFLFGLFMIFLAGICVVYFILIKDTPEVRTLSQSITQPITKVVYPTSTPTIKFVEASFEANPELHLESAIAQKGLGNVLGAKKEVERAIELAPKYEEAKAFYVSLQTKIN